MKTTPEVRKLVDEAGRLASWYSRIAKKKVERLASVKKEIAAAADTTKPAEEFLFSGRRYAATVSAQELESEIVNMQGVYDALGHQDFIRHCAVTFKVLDVFIPRDIAVLRGLVKREQTGSRSVTLAPREPKAAA